MTHCPADPDAASPDALLLRRIASGDEAAIEALYESHVDGLYAFVFYRVGREPALAEDVVQDTFLAALDAATSFDPGRGSARAWLCTISRNVIRRHLRHHPRTEQLGETWARIDEILSELFAALEGAPLSDELIAREQTRDLVSMTIANLPDRYRSVLERKYVGGESLGELARELELSEDAAKSLLARARRAFRETFEAMSRALATETNP